MKKALLVFCAVLPLAMAQQPTADSAASLLGRWRSVETSKGGIGAVYHVHPDGTVEFSPGAIVDMPYRVEGDQVIFPPGTTNGSETKFTLSWSSDRMMRLATQDHVDEY